MKLEEWPTKLTCRAFVIGGRRRNQVCGKTATMIYTHQGTPVCGVHARAYTRAGLARLAYWRPKEEAWM